MENKSLFVNIGSTPMLELWMKGKIKNKVNIRIKKKLKIINDSEINTEC